jgi:hypothetical protein
MPAGSGGEVMCMGKGVKDVLVNPNVWGAVIALVVTVVEIVLTDAEESE